jgi:outer membrane protein assembly factor BamB
LQLLNNKNDHYSPMKNTHFFIFLVILFFSACKKSENKNNWTATVSNVVSSSSPREADLNGDGILDIVMGAGGEEWKRTEKGIVAIDGASGEVLWVARSSNQLVGTPIFQDLDDDGTLDVIIGGRSAELQALDGKNGHLLWKFYEGRNAYTARDEGFYNFYNPQFVKDQDNDGVADLLICNGGDALATPDVKYRPSGKLMLLSSKTGKVITEAKMPDGQETYATPVCFDCETNGNPTYIFGSGGETRKGHLYLAKLSDLKSGSLKNAEILDSTTKKGYEAPPILADFNGDKQLDILFNTVEGKTTLLDGKTHKPIWSVECDSAEIFSQPAIGYFTGNDRFLDVFVNFAIGIYPTYNRTEQWLMDGKTGKVVKKFQNKRFTYSSPLTADLNNDGVDEVVMNMVKDSTKGKKQIPYYELTIFDFKNQKIGRLGKPQNGACFASTPLLTDLDHDGKLDVIYSGSPAVVSEFPGNTTFERSPMILFVHRMELDSVNVKSVKWGSYMGKEAKSIWR